ncbi:hypothetical protein F9L33_13945 [Amylibacter sp. SFDW26]|uniref:hypothetical protein n=1 Tax=Amylibacter sp. SFDW26 TaxID=2652722 RepID=UPI0012629369|nr:hypothetical protein [Amylibacter sp. SFDW26]KAB7610399.1 hypothetical protein F9L33_13945 [Amylibacter sp. SFDW26]
MKSQLTCCIVALSLTGCVSQPPLAVKPEIAPAKLQANAPSNRVRDDKSTKTTVRAYKTVKEEGKKDTQVEVAGAICTLQSDHLSAKVVTPQKVELPKYDQIAKLEDRGVPPSILVKCTAGNLKGQSLLTANPGKIISGSGNLIADLVLIAGSAAAAATADWRYAENVAVVLK